jgi:hypothetical protein
VIPEQIAAPKPNTSSDSPAVSQIEASQSPLRRFRWEEWITLADPISPTAWISDTGLLRSTQSGASLEMGELKVRRLATMSIPENIDNSRANKLKPIASFADGKILIGSLAVLHRDSGVTKTEPQALAARDDTTTTNNMASESRAFDSGSGFSSGQGEAVMWGTFPSEDYSNLGYTSGVVLYVAVQRALESGLRSLKSTVEEIAQAKSSIGDDFKTTNIGSRLPSRDQWEPLLTTDRFLSSQIESHAGIFRASSKLVSVHRPVSEDETKTLETADWNRLFEGVPIKRLSEQTGSRDDLQSESWRTFMMILIIALLVEAVMSLPKSKN